MDQFVSDALSDAAFRQGNGASPSMGSPSIGDVLSWRSLRWADGSIYEGLEAYGACQSHGAVTYANGDRYEGQLQDSRMEGYGMYRWSDGTLYRGQWQLGRMQGCGVRIWRDTAGAVQAQAGRFMDDDFMGQGVLGVCDGNEAHAAALEADVAAHRARSFEADVARPARNANLQGGGRAARQAPSTQQGPAAAAAGRPGWWSWLGAPRRSSSTLDAVAGCSTLPAPWRRAAVPADGAGSSSEGVRQQQHTSTLHQRGQGRQGVDVGRRGWASAEPPSRAAQTVLDGAATGLSGA